MLQEPVSVKLGDEWKHVLVRGRQVLKRVSSYGYRVPLLKSLQVFNRIE